MRRSLGFGPAAPAAGPAESLAAHPPNPSSTSRTLDGRRGIVHPDSVAPYRLARAFAHKALKCSASTYSNETSGKFP